MQPISLPIVPITLLALYRVAQVLCASNNPAPYPCPDLDGSPYASATGSRYHIQCSTDYPGNDLPAVHTDTFEGCLEACDAYVPGSSAEADNYASCIGVSWGAGNPSANCYLKFQITTINQNDVGLSSGYHANYTLPNSVVTSLGIGPSTTNAPVTSTTRAAETSAIQAAPTHGNGSDSHMGIGAGAGVGVGVGVVVGSAILAAIFYLVRRRPRRRRPGESLELSAEEDDRKGDKRRKPSAEAWIDELPAENRPGELSDLRGARAELFEIRASRAEVG